MRTLFLVLDVVLEVYIWLLLVFIVRSWLIDFSAVAANNKVMATSGAILGPLTEPILRPLRYVAKVGTVDASPVLLIVLVIAARYGLYALRNHLGV
jgi:YggT family protein